MHIFHKERQNEKKNCNLITPFNNKSAVHQKNRIPSFRSLTFLSIIHLNIKYSSIDLGTNSLSIPVYMFRLLRNVRKILPFRVLFCMSLPTWMLPFWFGIWIPFNFCTETSCLVLYMLNAYYVSHDDLCIVFISMTLRYFSFSNENHSFHSVFVGSLFSRAPNFFFFFCWHFLLLSNLLDFANATHLKEEEEKKKRKNE